MLENKNTGEVTTTEKHPLSDLSYYLQAYANVKEIIAFSLPSPQITPKHMLELADKIMNMTNDFDGFVITHGTDTLEETAYFLDLVMETNKPVIITGAMRSSNEIGSDALYNLISSLRVAADNEAGNKGVLIVMNDEIHTASNVTKTSTSNVATFQSPQYGPIGIITKESIIFHHTILKRHIHPVNQINKNVFLLKAYAGMDEQIISSLHKTMPDGIVIEGLGQGNLPVNTVYPIEQMIEDNIPVILVSRCFQGIVQPIYAYNGGGKQLREKGVILANGLTGPKARIKLMIALETTNDAEELTNIFEKEY